MVILIILGDFFSLIVTSEAADFVLKKVIILARFPNFSSASLGLFGLGGLTGFGGLEIS